MGLLPQAWDPRRRKEPSAGPTPDENGAIQLDPNLAILVEEVVVSKVETDAGEPDVYALELTGILNRDGRRAPSLFLLKQPHVDLIVAGFQAGMEPGQRTGVRTPPTEESDGDEGTPES